ncbi:MAG: hypothetical protein ACOX2Q_12715 [Dehalobacterium sp.]|jgi:nickel transport protein
MKSKLKGSVIFGIICLFLLIPSMADAHGMFLRLEESGVLRAEYDGGGFSSRTEVTIYDAEGNELGKGPVDEEGKYHFDQSLDVHSAVADDGMGHRAEYKKGVEEKSIPKVPVVIGVFLVIAIISVIFNKRSKLKKQQ